MVVATAAVSYKKKGGQVKLLEHLLEFTEAGQTQPALSIAIRDVQNLQASPASASSAQMRIFALAATTSAGSGGEPIAHTFKFTATPPPEARKQMEAFVAALQKGVANKRAAPADSPSAAATPDAAGTPVADANPGAAKASLKRSLAQMLATADVENDTELQQSLLRTDKELSNTFREAVVNGGVTNAQFWSSRVHLLRAHLVETSQQRGPYNVLATVRPKTVDNKIRVNMTREKIRDVFEQHPLLKRVYDETVPPLTEEEFWARFFVSRLCKKLRGERVLMNDPVDTTLDKYLDDDEFDISRRRAEASEADGASAVPYVIDLEGNEEHHSRRMGNAPDLTMRPQRTDVVNAINAISLRMLDGMTPAERVAADVRNNRFERDFYENDMRLADLRQEQEDQRVILNIRDHQTFLRNTSSIAATTSITSQTTDNSPENDKTILRHMRDELPGRGDHLDLGRLIGGLPQADLDSASTLIGSMKLSAAHRSSTTESDTSAHDSLPRSLSLQTAMCHAAAQEFLALFWRLLMSGDPRNARQLGKMAGTGEVKGSLVKTYDRVDALARLAKKENADPQAITIRMKPTLDAVDRAIEVYNRALSEATTATPGTTAT
ncbi:RNA polymerase II transcription factor B subunit 1 [Savitreella phatthalungensis]